MSTKNYHLKKNTITILVGCSKKLLHCVDDYVSNFNRVYDIAGPLVSFDRLFDRYLHMGPTCKLPLFLLSISFPELSLSFS